MSEVTALLRLQVKEEVTKEFKKASEEMKKLQGESKRTGGFIQDMFREFAGPAAALGAAGSIALIGKESILAADRLQNLQRRAEAVFGETFSGVNGQVEQFAQTVGRSSSDVLAFATSFATIAQGAGLAAGQVDDLSTELTRATIDFGSFFGLADQEAFQIIQQGLVGAGRELKKYGVTVDDAALAEYAHSKGIEDKVSEMGEAQKSYLKSQLLLQQLSKYEGDAAENADSLRNSTEKLKGAFGDLFEAIGTPALPVLADQLGLIAEVTRGTVIPAIQDLFGLFAGFSGDIANLFGLGSIPALAGAQSDAISLTDAGLKPLSYQVKKTGEDVKSTYRAIGGGSSTAGKEATSRLKEVQEAMHDLGREYDDARDKIAESLTDLDVSHREKMERIREELKSTKDSLADLRQSYDRDLAGISRTQEDAIGKQADKIEDLQEKLKKLNDEREGLNIQGLGIPVKLNEEIQTTTKELEAQTAALEKAKGQLTPEQLKEAGRRGGLTDIERDFEDAKRREKQLTEDFNKRKGQLEEEIRKIADKARIEQEENTLHRQELLSTSGALEIFHNDYILKMQNLSKVTKDEVKAMKESLQDLQRSLSSAQVTAKAKFNVENDVDTRRDERPSQAGNITINFGDVKVGSQGDIDALINALTRKLQLQEQGAN